MSTTATSLDAFAKAVVADYNDDPRYPANAIVLPATVTTREFLAATEHHDLNRVSVVFVREDGAELIVSPRSPSSLLERVKARLGLTPLDITVRPPDGPLVYHDRRAVRARDVVAYEQRVFAFA